MPVIATFVSGLLFGVGLIVSGLVSPGKVLGFLDVAGAWDPTLAFVMAAAVATTAVGYKLAFARGRPLFSTSFQIPTKSDIDGRLMTGAALFGIGWGLVGFCPGPAIASLSIGSLEALIFVIAMLGGMALARTMDNWGPRAVVAPAGPKGGSQ